MAGWRRDDDIGEVEPVELIDDGDRTEGEVSGGRDLDWHAVLRTGAAIVAALSLLWMGRSWADERSVAGRAECANELQDVLWRWEEAASQRGLASGRPQVPTDVMEQILARARECGDDLFADAIEYRMSPAEDED